MHLNEKYSKLEELKKYLRDVEDRANKLLENFDWNKEDTLRAFNSNSGEKKNSNVDKDCKEDPNYPETFKQSHTVTLNEEEISKIFGKTYNEIPNQLPNKFSDMQTQFDREQKLKIYDYVVSKTGKFTEIEFASIPSKEDSKDNRMSFADIVALRRDMKRRRLKYKIGKDPPLSTTEELRNLIEIQMSALEEYNNQNSTKYTKKYNQSGDRESHPSKSDPSNISESSYLRTKDRSKNYEYNILTQRKDKSPDYVRNKVHERYFNKPEYKKVTKEKQKSHDRKKEKSLDRKRSKINIKNKKSKKKSKTKHKSKDHSPNMHLKNKKHKKKDKK